MRLSRCDLAYIAGFWDGEGSIGAHRAHLEKRRTTIKVSVTNTRKEVILWIRRKLGMGRLRTYVGKKVNHKQAFRLDMKSTDAVRVCEILLPYLRLKKQQAKLVIKLGYLMRQSKALGGRKGRRAYRPDLQDKITTKLYALNKRGIK